MPEPLTGLACSVMAEPGVKISPAVGLVMDTIGAPLPLPLPPVEVGLGLGLGLGEGDGEELPVEVGDGDGDGEALLPPLQAVPFSVNEVGAVLLPL